MSGPFDSTRPRARLAGRKSIGVLIAVGANGYRVLQLNRSVHAQVSVQSRYEAAKMVDRRDPRMWCSNSAGYHFHQPAGEYPP
jgi:hypothetical protein